MRTRIQRFALLAVLVGGSLALSSASANAATTQISGVGVFDAAGVCDPPPAGYEDFTISR